MTTDRKQVNFIPTDDVESILQKEKARNPKLRLSDFINEAIREHDRERKRKSNAPKFSDFITWIQEKDDRTEVEVQLAATLKEFSKAGRSKASTVSKPNLRK